LTTTKAVEKTSDRVDSHRSRVLQRAEASENDSSIIIVSSDTHIGPRLEDMRPYCPQKYLDDYDAFTKKHNEYREAMRVVANQIFHEDPDNPSYRATRNIRIPGHYDIEARIKDLNSDGVAGEVIFHGSQNDEPMPFTNLGDPKDMFLFKAIPPVDPEMAAEGLHIYNRWLADICSVEPERHVGLAHLPMWDVEGAARELAWARDNGLRGINFPAPQQYLPAYNKPHWDPLWRAAEENAMPLNTHIGAASDADFSGADGRLIGFMEQSLLGPRALNWLVFGGVFERFPGLKFVVTEIPGPWFSRARADMDSLYRMAHQSPQGENFSDVFQKVPKLPSEYCEENLMLGASFMSKGEAEAAFEGGYYTHCMWGSDYPHAEGSFQHFDDDEQRVEVTRLALRSTFSALPSEAMRLMMGLNAVELYGLDQSKLQKVAERIGAPTPEDVAAPVDGPPEGIYTLAFRRRGTWD
jgi:predicted TIM-barrel fold metal-dependent hydrolase